MTENNVYSPELGNQTAVATNTAVTVTSSAVTTISAIDRGIKRIISNNSTDVLYMTKTNTTGGATTGIIISSKRTY